MTLKHAYLVMAHHRPDLLAALLEALDDSRNDIYLHIDAKSGPEMRPEQFSVAEAGLHIIPSMSVNWGGYSQIRCTMELMQAAVTNGPYARYHLMTGATYPLKSQTQIRQFFDDHAQEELITYDAPSYSERVRYAWLFSERGKSAEERWLLRTLRGGYLKLQKLFRVDRFRRFHMEYKKGLAYWSITQNLTEYVLSRREVIEQMTGRSVCGDEVFMQTIAWNSPFRNCIYDAEGIKGGALRSSTWEVEDHGQTRPGHNFTAADRELLLSSNALFALKFEGEDGPELIAEIRKHIESTQ